MKLALALLFIGAGVTLIYSGLTGEPLTPALAAVLAGKNPPGKLGQGFSDTPITKGTDAGKSAADFGRLVGGGGGKPSTPKAG